MPWPKYEEARYVHVADHASKKGIGLISGSINWEQLAEKLRIVAPRLEGNQKRDLCLSCCHSEDGLTKMKQHLQGHFTGCYYFNDKQIEFDRTITIWSMFYWKKTSETKKGACKRIQKFFGDEILKHEDI